MSIWRILGFGTNEKALAEEQEILAKRHQKATEYENMLIEGICRNINYFGIHKLIERNDYPIKDIKAVLSYFKETPIKSTYWEKNWPEAQQWLFDQEHPELKQTQKELEEIKNKIEEFEKYKVKTQRYLDKLLDWNKELQDENHKLKVKIVEYEKNKKNN